MRNLIVGGFCLALAAFAACNPPRYAPYASPFGDFRCEAPWGWHVVSEAAVSDYSNVTFLGPVDPAFYRKMPSFSVRWYRSKAPHRLPDGSYESYASAEDYKDQLLRYAYGPDGKRWAGSDRELSAALSHGEALPETERITLPKMPGQEAAYFVMFHDILAPAGEASGVTLDGRGRREILERHAYVVLPMAHGFYVLIYPATRDGFETYRAEFNHLINSFQALREGPGGPEFSTIRHP